MLKRIISLLIILSVLSVGFTVSADFTDLTNLALNKTVSSTTAATRTQYVTDGSNAESTRNNAWFGSGTGKHFVVDLGEISTFNTIVIYEYSQKITGYKIETSSDNSVWSTFAESSNEEFFTASTGVTNQYLATLTFTDTTAQYIKFTVKTATGTFYIQEIEVYNDPNVNVNPPEGGEEPEEPTPDDPVIEDPQNFAKYKSVEVSKVTSGKDHTKVTDGIKNISTSADSWNVKAGNYIIIDLASQKSFDCVVLYEYSHIRTKGFIIETSNDKSDWTKVFSDEDEFLTGYGGTTSATSNAPHYYGKFLFDKTTAQYVKITVVGIDSTMPAYIEEIEVYDQTNMPAIEEGEEIVDITLDPPVVVNDLPYEDENFHIYLFLGQSNMAGRGALLKEDYVVVDNAYLLNSDGNWEYAQVYPKEGSQYSVYQGYNRYSNVDEDSKNRANPALSFTRTMRENLSEDIGIGIISNAKGGTTVKQWQKDYVTSDGSDNLYKKTLGRTKAALEKGGVIKGIMWLQGDSDAANDGYLDNLKIFVDDLRADLNLNENEVPFIASQYVPAKVEQNAAIANIASTVTNSDYISSEGTDSVGDNLHFDGESQRLLGCRYAEKIMNKVYGKNITATELYNSVYLVRPDDLPDAFNVPIDKFTSDEEENDSVTVKNHLGEMQTITGHYMVLLTKVAPGTSDYTLEEYGISISEDGINYHQDAKSLVELTANNAYCMLVHNLKASKTYYFRPYAVYKDASGNLWTVNGEEVITHEVK